MNTDTPETDAFYDGEKISDDQIFAQGLERQRNAAIKRLESSQEARAVMREELSSVKELLEREQLRLAACGVIALADTPESALEARKMHPDYESASCNDVARRVDECIKLRQMVRELRDALDTLANNGHTDDCLMLNRANSTYDCGVDDAKQLITKANQLLS